MKDRRHAAQSRALAARVQPPRAGAGRGRRRPAARAAAVPVHPRQQSRRVLRDPGRRYQGTAAQRARARRHDAAPAARALLRQIGVEVRALIADQYRLLNDDVLPALARKRRPPRPPDRLHRRRERMGRSRYFEREVRPLLTPIGLDPAHPFPQVVNKSLNFIVELAGSDAFGRETSIAIVKAPRVAAAGDQAAAGRAGDDHSFVMLSSVIHAHLRHAVPGARRRQLRAVPRHPRRRPVDRRGGGQEPAPGAAGRARRSGSSARRSASRSPTSCPDRLASFLLQQFELDRGRPLPLRRPGQHRAAGLADRRRRPGRTQVRAVRAGNSGRAAPRAGHPRRDPCRRHPAAPPLPVVRAGRRVHPPCRRRSRRPVDQADRLPHRRQLGADGGTDRGRALRQGGHRRHRTDGALRRGDQHQLGGPARAGRRAGRLRRVRAQDPRQARPAVAPRNRPARPGAPGPVRAPRHRQLPSADDAPVHRLRAPDLRPRRSAPTSTTVFMHITSLARAERLQRLLLAPFTMHRQSST